jgi:hypothetical protein
MKNVTVLPELLRTFLFLPSGMQSLAPPTEAPRTRRRWRQPLGFGSYQRAGARPGCSVSTMADGSSFRCERKPRQRRACPPGQPGEPVASTTASRRCPRVLQRLQRLSPPDPQRHQPPRAVKLRLVMPHVALDAGQQQRGAKSLPWRPRKRCGLPRRSPRPPQVATLIERHQPLPASVRGMAQHPVRYRLQPRLQLAGHRLLRPDPLHFRLPQRLPGRGTSRSKLYLRRRKQRPARLSPLRPQPGDSVPSPAPERRAQQAQPQRPYELRLVR